MADVFPLLLPDLRDADAGRSVDRAQHQDALLGFALCVPLDLALQPWDVPEPVPDRPDADQSGA